MLRLTSVLALLLAGPALAETPPPAPASKPAIEPMLDQPSVKVVKLTLAPGGVLPTHTTPVHATVVALSGSGVVVIADKKIPVAEHGAVFLPKQIPHSVINTGKVPLVMAVHHLSTTR